MGMDELRAALTENPSNTRAFQTEFDVLLETAEWAEIQDFIHQLADIVGEGSELENLLRVADFRARSKAEDKAPAVQYAVGCVFRDRLANEDVAEMYFRKIPEDSPLAGELVEFYKGFYVRKNNWRKLEQFLTARSEAADASQAEHEARLELARLADTANNAERAAAYWQQVYKSDPGNLEAEARLLEILREAGKWHALADLIWARIERKGKDQADEKVALLRELVPIYRDKMNAESKVTKVYQEILEINPQDQHALEALAEHYQSTNRFPDLVKLLRLRADAEETPEVLVELHRRIAGILLEKFSNMTEAMKSYEVILDLVPGDIEATAQLKDIYEKRRDWASFIRVAMLEVDGEADDELRLIRLKDLAELAAERIAKPETGIQLWQRVLEVEPQNVDAVTALEGLYEKAKDHEALADLLETKLGLVHDPKSRAGILEKVAILLGVRLQDYERAANAWRRLLELDPGHGRAKVELRKITLQSKDLEAIKWFFDNFGTPHEYVRSLESLVKEEEDDTIKVHILLTMADQFRDSEGEERHLAKILEQILEVQPDNVDAARSLVPVYRILGKWDNLVETMELVLAGDPDLDDHARLALLLDKAQVQEDRLRQFDEAFFTYVQAYQVDWRDPEVHREMERLAEASENWDSYVAVLEQTLELIEDDNYKAQYLVRIAEIWWEKLEQPQLAVERYQAVLEYQADNVGVLASLERLFEQLQRWQDIVPVIQRRLELEGDPDARAEIQLKIGEIFLGRLGDVEGTLGIYRAMMEERPADPAVYRRLSSVLAGEKRFAELLEVLRRQLSALGEDQEDADDLLVDLAELTYGVEGSLDGTVDLLEQAADRSLDNIRAFAFMEELLAAEPIRYRLACILEGGYAFRSDTLRLADALEIQLASDAAPKPARLLERLVELYRSLQDSDKEYATLCRLFDRDPDRGELCGRMEELAEELEDWPRLVSLYVEAVDRLEDPKFSRQLKKGAAAIYHLRMDDLQNAEALYRSLLDEDPTDQGVLGSLERISIESENWEALFEIYTREKELAQSPQDQIQILFRMATVCEDELGDLPKATETMEEIVQIDPDDRAALGKLDDLYMQQERWEDLLQVIRAAVALEEDLEVKVAMKLRAAGLFEEQVGDIHRMTATLAEILELDPGCNDAVRFLERNLEGEAIPEILPLLDRYYRNQENWLRVIDLLELRMGIEDDPESRKATQVEVAEIYEYRLDDQEAAFAHHRKALALDPADRAVMAQLQRLAGPLGLQRELFDVMVAEYENIRDETDREWMARTIARWARSEFDDHDEAVRWFRRVLEMSHGDVEALDILASIFRETEAWLDLTEVLRQRADGETDSEARKDFLVELGGIHQDFLDRPEDAVAVFTEILDVSPGEPLALANLDVLLSDLQRWEQLVEILEQKAALSDDPEMRRFEMMRRAEILDVNLERLDDAQDVYRMLLSTDPKDLVVLHHLQDLYSRKGDWFSAIEVYRTELELLEGTERVPVLFRMGEIWVEHLDSPVEAVPLYTELLALVPESEDGMAAVERIVLEKAEKQGAFDLLSPILEARCEWERLLVNLEALLGATEAGEERVRLALRMADLARDQLQEPVRAFSLLQQALETAPERSDVADLIEDVARETGLWDDLVDILRQIATDLDDPQTQLMLRKREARILKDEVQRFEEAITAFAKLRADFPDDLDALESLDQLVSILERWDDLESILLERMERAADPDERILLGFRLSMLLEENLGRMGDACQVMKDLHYLNPEREEVVDQLRRFFDNGIREEETLGILDGHYRARDAWADVSRVLEGRLDVALEAEDRLDICRQLAGTARDRLDDLDAALRWTGEVLVLDPEDEGALARLKDLGRDLGRLPDVASYVERAASQSEMEETHIRLALEAGWLLSRELDDLERAELFFLEALDLDAEQPDALEALDDLYGGQNRFEEQEKVLARRAANAQYPEKQVELLMRLGRLWEDRLANADGAIEAYRGVLDVDEQNKSALNELARLLGMLERYAELIPIYQAKADFASDPDERISFYRQVAELTERRLDDPEGAIEKWEDVLAFSSQDMAALDNLIRLYEQLGKWGEMVDVCRRAATIDGLEVQRKVLLWEMIARAAEAHLDEQQTAEEFWVKVRETDRGHAEAQASLRRLYRNNENFSALAILLEEMARGGSLPEPVGEPEFTDSEPDEEAFAAEEYTGDGEAVVGGPSGADSGPEAPPTGEEEEEQELLSEGERQERIEIWSELARLRMEESPDPTAAIAAWREVAALEPRHREALDALESLYEESGRWQDCIDVLRTKLDLVEPEGRVAVLGSVAEILESDLQDWNGAIDARREILDLEPEELRHYSTLEDLLESQGRWTDLAELQTRKCEILDPGDRLETYRSIANLYENQLQDSEGAFLLYQRALDDAPTDEEALDGVERVARDAGLFAELRSVWEVSVEAFEDPLEQLKLLRKLAFLDRDELHRSAEAVEWFQRIRTIDEDDEEALQALVGLYESLGQWSDLADALEKLAGLTTDFREQTSIFLRLGDCLKERLHQPEKAVAAYREVLEMDPTEERAIKALEDLYGQTEDWASLIEVLGMRATVHPEEETSIKLLRGMLYEERLEDNERAADEYEEVLAYEPANHEAIGRLKKIYSEAGNWTRLSDTLERSLALTNADEERIELMTSLAMLQEEALEDRGQAADYYQQILDLEPENLGAIEALERLYMQEERFEDLVGVLKRHAELIEGIAPRVDLLEQAAALYVQEIGDLDSAITVNLVILDLDPTHMPTLERLEGLYMEQGSWDQVLDILDRKIRIADNEATVLDLYLRKGAIYREEMYAPDRAKEQYLVALDRAPASIRAADELVTMYTDESDWERAIAILQSVSNATGSDEERAPIQVRMGGIYREHLEDADQAIDMYEAALDGIPGMPEAMDPLVEIYLAQERWAKVTALLQLVRERVENEGDSDRLVDVLHKTGYAAQQMGDNDEALRHYRAAYDKNQGHIPTLTGLAALNQRMGNFDSAETYYRSLLHVAETQMDADQRVSVYRALGEVEMELGRPKLAEEYLAQVIQLQPHDRACLDDLARLMELHQDYEGVVRYKEKLLELVDDSLERLTIQIGIGDTYREKLSRIDKAIDAYRGALSIDPGSRTALVKLLEIFIQSQRFDDAVEILQQLLDAETEPRKKAYYTFTIATIYREHLGQPVDAVEFYQQTLDLDHSKLEAFQAVDELLTEQKSWDDLETSYRKMIGRVKDTDNAKLLFMLYKNLGEIYRSRLDRPDYAQSSFELAAKLKPDDVKVHEILAQLYENSGELEKAVATQRVLAQNDPERVSAYKQMMKFYQEMGRRDEAWVTSSILVLLRKASGEEATFYKEHRTPSVPQPQRSLDAGLWSQALFSKGENQQVGEIFQILYEVVGHRMGGKDLKDLGLKRRDEVNVKDRTLFGNVFRTVSHLLGITAPKVYLSEKSFGIHIEGTVPPVLVIGRDMLEQKTDRELGFVLGKYLTYFHPSHLFAGTYGSAALKMLYSAALRFVHPEVKVEGNIEDIESLREELARKISSPAANRLGALVEYFHSHNQSPGLSRWLTNVELTANHAGLLACGDLDVAAKSLAQESISFSKLPPKEKVKELVLYAISEDYLALRKTLGINVE
ncbi:MAG: tetratricopeptide repeat protein [Pseudomonadota bacterium]